MSIVLSDAPPTEWTIADVQARLAGFPAWRIRTYPAPGTATEKDLLKVEARTGRICELIDGTLVEKVMASLESMLAAELIYFIRLYLQTNDIGMVTGADGLLKILPKQIRDQRRLHSLGAIRRSQAAQGPDLCGRTGLSRRSPFQGQHDERDESETARVLSGRCAAGVVHRAGTASAEPVTASAMDGDWSKRFAHRRSVLPGFELPLAELFARVERPRKG